MRARLAAVLLLLAGCGGDGGDPVRLEVPLRPEHGSYVLGIETDHGLRVLARDVAEDGSAAPAQVSLQPGRQVTLTALLYRGSLEANALSPGELELEPVQARQRPLPAADRVQRLILSDRSPSSWMPADLSPALSSYRIAVAPCPELDGRSVSLGQGGRVTFVLAMDERWVLVGTSRRTLSVDPDVRFIDRNGTLVRQEGLPSSFFSAYREGSGRIWLGGERGVIYRGRFLGGEQPRIDVVATATVPNRQDVVDLVGPKSGVPDERFALTSMSGRIDHQETAGDFVRFEGNLPRGTPLIHTMPRNATWVSSGYALFASWFRGGEVLGLREGQPASINVDSFVLGNVSRIESIPGLGLVAGTTGSEVHLQREGQPTWALIDQATTEPIVALHPFETGFLYATGTTMFWWRAPAGPSCGPYGILGLPEAVVGVTVISEEIILALADPQEGLAERFVAWFTVL